MKADRELALLLDKSVKNVKILSAEQGELLYKGLQRLTWYTSCFFDNYQDVCENLKNEDIRMMHSVEQVYKRADVIYDMIKLYVDTLIHKITSEKIKKVQKSLIKFSSFYASTHLTNQSIAYVVAKSISESFGFSFVVREKINAFSKGATFALSVYGRVHSAAEAAERLKVRHPIYYNILYMEKLEMLYFLIEPYISQSIYFGTVNPTDDELISILEGLIR